MKQRFPGKIFLIRKQWIHGFFLLLAVICIFTIVNHPRLVGQGATERLRPIYYMTDGQDSIILTFDATGEADQYTQDVIELLFLHQLRALFFITEQWAIENADLAQTLIQNGHQIGLLVTDLYLPRIRATEIPDILNASNDTIEQQTGVRPRLIRLPYDDYDDNVIAAVRNMELDVMQWSSGGNLTPGAIVRIQSNDCSAKETLVKVLENVMEGEFVVGMP